MTERHLRLTGWSGDLDGVETDRESQHVGSADDAFHGAVGVAAGEVVTAQIVVVDIVSEHLPHRGQDGVRLIHATR
jgi:hypothetical protein